MTERNQWSRKFAELLIDLNSVTLDFNDVRHVKTKMRWMLIDSLSSQQFSVFTYVTCHNKPVTTAQVMEDFKLNNNHASGLLKSLYELGLLTRQQVTDEHGKHYEYRRVE